MKTIPIKVFPKNTLIKYFPMNNVEFKIGRIKSCRIISTDVYYSVELNDGQYSIELSSKHIALFCPRRPMITKTINVFEPGEFVFFTFNFNRLNDFHIGKIISVKMTGNRPTYNIMLLDGKVIEVETNTFIKLFHDQIMRAANDRTFLQLSEEVKRWKQDDDFIKYMSDKTIFDTAGLMIRR